MGLQTRVRKNNFKMIQKYFVMHYRSKFVYDIITYHVNLLQRPPIT